MALYISISRIVDYYHHPVDVIVSKYGCAYMMVTIAVVYIFRQEAFWDWSLPTWLPREFWRILKLLWGRRAQVVR